MMEYKGYIGKAELDDDAGIFHGEVTNTRDVITFEGESVHALKRAFRESVDDYLDFCTARGEAPKRLSARVIEPGRVRLAHPLEPVSSCRHGQGATA